MVKLGFIVEGNTEKILFRSEAFSNYMKSLGIDFIPEIIDAKGNGNLLPQHITEFTEILKDKGATKIFIIADLETAECVTKTKERISPGEIHQCIISKKAIESWFLADTLAMRNYLGSNDYACENPEEIENPFEEIKKQRLTFKNKGVNDKKILARTILGSGFSFENIISNQACSSARYFHQKLIQYSTNN
jgi:hypothetical protein